MHRGELPIVRACEQSWDDLDGNHRVRHCGACDHEVLNLSAMTVAEAREVIERARTTRVCVRYRVGADGTVMFAPSTATLLAARPIALGVALLAAAPLLAPAPPEMALPPVAAAPMQPQAPRPVVAQPVAKSQPAPPPAPAPKPKKRKKPDRSDHDDSMGRLIVPLF